MKLIAFDFDETIVDIHTGGRWTGSDEELVSHVRPDFRCVIARCLDEDENNGTGIYISVATFSTQKELISSVLSKSTPNHRAKDIPIFGRDDVVPGYTSGKQSQLLLSIREAQQAAAAAAVTLSTTMLVDDDPRNVKVANADGYRTIHYVPGRSLLYHVQRMPG